MSWAVSAFSLTSIAKMKVSQHPVSLIQCWPSSQLVFELVSRDCQPHSHFSCLSLSLSTSLYITLLLYHSILPRSFICCRPLRTSPCCLALLASIRGSGMSSFSSALFFSFSSPLLPLQPRDVCWFLHVLSLTLSPPLRTSQPKRGDWR